MTGIWYIVSQQSNARYVVGGGINCSNDDVCLLLYPIRNLIGVYKKLILVVDSTVLRPSILDWLKPERRDLAKQNKKYMVGLPVLAFVLLPGRERDDFDMEKCFCPTSLTVQFTILNCRLTIRGQYFTSKNFSIRPD